MWNKKKIIYFYYVFVECFPLRREKNEMNKFYNRAICSLKFMDKEKCAVPKWNKEGPGSDTGLLSNTGKWPLRGETNKS